MSNNTILFFCFRRCMFGVFMSFLISSTGSPGPELYPLAISQMKCHGESILVRDCPNRSALLYLNSVKDCIRCHALPVHPILALQQHSRFFPCLGVMSNFNVSSKWSPLRNALPGDRSPSDSKITILGRLDVEP